MIVVTKESPSVIYLCSKDKRLAKAISMVGDLKYKPHDDSYAFLVHEIIEQMLSIKAGKKIYSRLIELCDGVLTPERVALLSIEDIKSIGTSSPKAKYIKGVTDAVISGKLDFESIKSMPDNEVKKALTSIKGIGDWTAQMYLIFVLDRPDVLPTSDAAFLQVYRWLYKTDDCSKKSVETKCKKWRPYSSVAVRYFYQLLDAGYTKEEFHLFK